MTVNFDFMDGSLATRPYIPPTTFRSTTEDQLSRRLQDVFLASTIAAKSGDWLKLATHWVDHGWDSDAFGVVVSSTFKTAFAETVLPLLIDSAMHGVDTAQQDFSGQVPVREHLVVTPWGQVYSNQLAAQLALGSEKAVQDLVNDGLNSRMSAPALADRARQVYGLDQRSANTLKAYSQGKTLPRNQTLLDVAAKLLISRAHTMADNEVFAALNFGRQITYMEAQQAGLLAKDAKKTWVTALDERVCPVCKPMDGVSVPLLDTFEVMMPLPKTGRGKNRKSTQHVVPPVHPLCRCTIVPTERLEQGIITRTARFDDLMLSHHRARLLSDAFDIKKRFDPFQQRAQDGRWTKLGNHLNSNPITTTAFNRPERTALVQHLTFLNEDKVIGPMFRGATKDVMDKHNAWMKRVEANGWDPEGVEPAYPTEAHMIEDAAKANARVYALMRTKRFQNRLVKLAVDDTVDDGDFMESAKGVLESHQYRMINNADHATGDVLRLHFAAEAWSNTHIGVAGARNLETFQTEMKTLVAADPTNNELVAAFNTQYNEYLRKSRAGAFDTLIEAIDHTTAPAPKLIRGMTMPEGADLEQMMTPGHTFNLGLSSFTADREVAKHYATTRGMFGLPEKVPGMRSVFVELEKGAKALNIAPLTVQTDQAEWITRGKFVVTGSKAFKNHTVIKIAQVAEEALKVVKSLEPNVIVRGLHSPLGAYGCICDEEEVGKAFEEDKHPRDHGKFAHKIEVGALAAGAAAVGLRTPTGRNILMHTVGQERYFARAKPVAQTAEAFSPVKRVFMKPKPVADAINRVHQSKPLMSLGEETEFGQHGLFHPKAYAHLEGKTHDETVANIEEHIRHQKVEHGFLVAPNGKIISASRGNHYQAPMYIRHRDTKAFHGKLTFTHNHPDEGGADVVLSATDIAALHGQGLHKVRAVTPRGVVTQVRIHPDATKADSADYAARSIEHAKRGNEEAFRNHFGHLNVDYDNKEHISFLAKFQSKQMHEFYKSESAKGKFIYSVAQPKSPTTAAA